METYAAIILKKMLTSEDAGYVDLTSPSGMGIGAVAYNYDGYVYASDESRMLVEMGDPTFRLGKVPDNSYEEIFYFAPFTGPSRGFVRLQCADV